MQLLSLVSGILICAYGLLNAFAGSTQLKAGKIQPWSARLMLGFGLLLLLCGISLMMKLPFALWILGIGLIAIHLLTVKNGLSLYGRLNPVHHLFRLVISLALFGSALWSLQ